MEIPHFDCISYAVKKIHKYFKKYFTKPCCKTRISPGLKRYIEKFKPETKIYAYFNGKSILVNKRLALQEAIEYGEHYRVLNEIKTCRYIEESKNGNYATSPLHISENEASITYRYYRINTFLKTCGFNGCFESKINFTKRIPLNFKRLVKDKLFRLEHYLELFNAIMDELLDESSITLMENDPFRYLQKLNGINPNSEYIKNADTHEIINAFKPIDNLCETLGIDRIPVVTLIDSVKKENNENNKM